jgi:hypothetical protein
MRHPVLIVILLALAAEPAWPQTLTPGRPAGTKAAQHISYRQGFIAISVLAIALTFAVPGSSTSSTATSAATTS